MNFYAFEYEKNISFNSIEWVEDEYIKLISELDTLFIQKKIYSHNYPDDWFDDAKKIAKIGIAGEFDQLKEQIFILINYKEKNIYSNIDSVTKIKNILKESVNVEFDIFQRLVTIEDFEEKISKLLSISIKSHSLRQKTLFVNNILNFDNNIIPDLSEVENLKLELNYNLPSKKKTITKMYKKMVEEYNVGEVVFKGSNEDSLFQFNQQSLIQKIPVNLSKTGDGIYDYKEVYKCLKEII